MDWSLGNNRSDRPGHQAAGYRSVGLCVRLGIAALATIAGCNLLGPRQTAPDSFYGPSQPPPDSTGAPNDVGGTLTLEGATVAPGPRPSLPPPVNGRISETVREGIAPPNLAVAATTAPSVVATTVPTTGPSLAAATEPGVTTGPTASTLPAGQYMVVGAVVAEVHGQPIFANKVIAILQPLLRAKARELNADQFRLVAIDLINKEVQDLGSSELEYAAALANLNAEAKNQADALTMQWKSRQITAAGGSEELARRKAAAEGNDFDELANQFYRYYMTEIYYQTKVIPKIDVTAEMMRTYYDEHKDALFTRHAHATFLLIQVDPQKTGGANPKDAALEKITNLRKRAQAGEDFADLASKVNDNDLFKKPLSIDKGSFVLDDVESAVFALQPPQMTDIIYTHGAYYLAQLLSLTQGNVQPFEDQAVQDRIRTTLRAEQFRKLREEERQRLAKEDNTPIDQPQLQNAIDMAMQNYPIWAAK
jgi:parvulin-like peptidyl-prolyl isomerase